MSDKILKVNGISKTYRKFKAVDNASFELEKGKIYGFIGQNGAGKTTIIRMLAGVSIPDTGTIEIFGDSTPKGISEGRKRIGAIVENPALYMKISAYDNIKIQQMLYGVKNPGLADELLELVGLQAWGKKKVKDFSLGMRQRLGIAMALVGNPELLILDEPVNGLDPMGIVEIRQLLIKLNQERNITILISSHILSELYQLATDYIVINKGQIIEKLTLAQLEEKCEKSVVIQVEDMDRAKDVVVNVLKSEKYQILEHNIIKIFDYSERVRDVALAMMEAKVIVTYLNVTGESLEQYFVHLIGGASNV